MRCQEWSRFAVRAQPATAIPAATMTATVVHHHWSVVAARVEPMIRPKTSGIHNHPVGLLDLVRSGAIHPTLARLPITATWTKTVRYNGSDDTHGRPVAEGMG